MIIKASLTS